MLIFKQSLVDSRVGLLKDAKLTYLARKPARYNIVTKTTPPPIPGYELAAGVHNLVYSKHILLAGIQFVLMGIFNPDMTLIKVALTADIHRDGQERLRETTYRGGELDAEKLSRANVIIAEMGSRFNNRMRIARDAIVFPSATITPTAPNVSPVSFLQQIGNDLAYYEQELELRDAPANPTEGRECQPIQARLNNPLKTSWAAELSPATNLYDVRRKLAHILLSAFPTATVETRNDVIETIVNTVIRRPNDPPQDPDRAKS